VGLVLPFGLLDSTENCQFARPRRVLAFELFLWSRLMLFDEVFESAERLMLLLTEIEVVELS